MEDSIILGRHDPVRVAAVFDNARDAQRAARNLARETDLAPGQIRIVDPQGPAFGKKPRLQTPGVVRTLIRLHLVLAAIGALSGLFIAVGLILMGVPIAKDYPQMLSVTAAALGAVLALLTAGLLWSHRKGGMVVRNTVDGASEDDWTVVVHAATQRQHARASKILKPHVDGTR